MDQVREVSRLTARRIPRLCPTFAGRSKLPTTSPGASDRLRPGDRQGSRRRREASSIFRSLDQDRRPSPWPLARECRPYPYARHQSRLHCFRRPTTTRRNGPAAGRSEFLLLHAACELSASAVILSWMSPMAARGLELVSSDIDGAADDAPVAVQIRAARR